MALSSVEKLKCIKIKHLKITTIFTSFKINSDTKLVAKFNSLSKS
jgi:hypothetical protein